MAHSTWGNMPIYDCRNHTGSFSPGNDRDLRGTVIGQFMGLITSLPFMHLEYCEWASESRSFDQFITEEGAIGLFNHLEYHIAWLNTITVFSARPQR